MIGDIRQYADVKSGMYVDGSGQLELEGFSYESKYRKIDFIEFVVWITAQTQYQLDIETDVVDRWNEYKLISIQFGSCGFGKDRIQWFFQWSYLSAEEKQIMKRILEDKTKLKLIHNAKFEYIVLRFHDIIIENLYDTMLAEKILHGGDVSEDYALADISWKYLRIIMNKGEQTEFGNDVITDSKILYGITDVAYLDVIKRQQIEQAAALDEFGHDQLSTFGLEMEALLAFSDITYYGMKLDIAKWRANIALAEPVIQTTYTELNKWLEVEPFKSHAIKHGFISDKDRVTINFGAPLQRTELLKLLIPDISGGTKPIVKKYIRDNSSTLSLNEISILHSYMEKEYKPLEEWLIANQYNYLIENDYLIPANQPTINWNSGDQVLPMVQLVEKRLKGLSKEAVEKTTHKILQDRKAYINALTLISDYGEEFIRKYVDSDGMVRTNFNPILTTGRVSSSRPNMQNIIVNKYGVGTRYRNAFICEEDEDYVDSDYASQELTIIAYISRDPVWMEAIRKGQDLHSICAALVFKDKWKNAAQPDCAYYAMKVNIDGVLEQGHEKCKCKKHKELRDNIKEINFGLSYGMGEFKLAGKLGISVSEAMKMINSYFEAFPGIGKALEILGNFGIDHGYIMTLAPFYRKRWFPFWKVNKDYIEPHKLGVFYNPTLGEIERASKNMPIQGASADITKVAMILIREWIHENGYKDQIRIVAQVHDQITTICKKHLSEMWKVKMDELMVEAGKLVIPTGILKADTQITEFWTK